MKTKTLTSLFALTLALVIFTGCVAGSYFTWDAARKVERGMAIADVEAIMGPPRLVQTLDPDAKRLKYIWAYGTSSGGSGSYSVIFENGKAVEVPAIPSSFK